MVIITFILLGLVAGILSGILGLGGGIVMIPALVYFFGMSQHQAQGTSLAVMIPPIGLLAAWTYYKAGHVDIKIAALICLGFFFGGLAGAKIANIIPDSMLQKVFGIAMLAVGIKMIFFA